MIFLTLCVVQVNVDIFQKKKLCKSFKDIMCASCGVYICLQEKEPSKNMREKKNFRIIFSEA